MYSGFSEICKNVKINIFVLILTFFYVSESLLYICKLKLTFDFLQYIHTFF